MTESYLAAKIREALVAAKGSRPGAQRLLVEWAGRDDRLLRALALPFLKAIAGSAVDRVARRGGLGGRAVQAGAGPVRAKQTLSREALDQVVGQLGAAFRPAGAAAPEAPAVVTLAALRPDPAPRHSSNQEKAIRTIAAAFARKRLDSR